MDERRGVLKRALQLSAAALVAGLAGACTTARPTSRAAPAASAPPPDPGPAAPRVDGEPVPPPDLFDASILGPEFWLRPRTINWYRPQTDESLKLVYWKDGAVDDAVYQRMCHLLRDVDARKTIAMDPKLLETLWACQAFCARYGMEHPLHILSGYRTARTNALLVEQGLPAARKSLHLDGRATDMRIINLHADVLGALVQSFERGGVGFYSRPGTTGGWIHTDTGVNRVWRG